MIGKVIKGIAGLFVLIVVFNLFFVRATDTLEKNKSENQVASKEVVRVDEGVYLPPIVLKADINAALDKANGDLIIIKVDTFTVRGFIQNKINDFRFIDFSQYRFSGWGQGIISAEKLSQMGLKQYDELNDVTITIKRKVNLNNVIVDEVDADKSLYEILDIHLDNDKKSETLTLTDLDNTTGIHQLDICESSRDIYRNEGKLSFFLYCADFVGSDVQWGCVKNRVNSYGNFNSAIESCGIINNSTNKVSICEKIETKFLLKNSEDDNLLSCPEMTAYVENWECLDKHYDGSNDFLSTAEKCGFTDLML